MLCNNAQATKSFQPMRTKKLSVYYYYYTTFGTFLLLRCRTIFEDVVQPPPDASVARMPLFSTVAPEVARYLSTLLCVLSKCLCSSFVCIYFLLSSRALSEYVERSSPYCYIDSRRSSIKKCHKQPSHTQYRKSPVEASKSEPRYSIPRPAKQYASALEVCHTLSRSMLRSDGSGHDLYQKTSATVLESGRQIALAWPRSVLNPLLDTNFLGRMKTVCR